MIKRYEKESNLYTFILHVENSKHILEDITITKEEASIDDNYILKVVEEKLTNLPLIEVYEHGMLHVEYALQKEKKPQVKGVVQIKNSLVILNQLEESLREIIKKYAQEESTFNFLNHYQIPITPEFSALNEKEEILFLNSLAKDFLQQESIESAFSINILSAHRIEVDFLDVEKKRLAPLLFNFEKFLFNTLHFNMEVMYAPKQDQNRKRQ